MNYCQISNGVVVNRANFDGEMPEGWAPAGQNWIASEVAQIGWSYADGEFVEPPVEEAGVDVALRNGSALEDRRKRDAVEQVKALISQGKTEEALEALLEII